MRSKRLINRQRRERVREIARQNYVRQEFSSTDELRAKAFEGSAKQIKQEFGTGIFVSLLISIMIKLAMKYIEKWIENKFFGSDVPTRFEEIE
tara:strand:+ start:254 stop:532 length:279 start_codon:yes stop_codon:yes gene_type:complete